MPCYLFFSKKRLTDLKTILSRYIIKNFLQSFLSVFICFFLVIAILEFMEIVRKYIPAGIVVPAVTMVKLILYRSFITVSSFFSFIVLLGGIVFFSMMHNKLELTAMKAVSISTKNLLMALFGGVAILALLYITLLDAISTHAIKTTKAIHEELKQQVRPIDKSLTLTNSGIWFKDINKNNSYIISVKSFDKRESLAYNIRIFEFNTKNILERSIHSQNALVKQGKWELYNCHIFDIGGKEQFQKIMKLPINLSFSKITKMVMVPESVSFWSIGKYSDMLNKVGLSSLKYKVHWYSKLSSILQMFSFIVLVMAFCTNYNSRDTRTYALKVGILLIFVFPVYFLGNILIAFGETGVIPLWMASFIIPVLIFLIGIFVLEKY